MRYRGQGHEIVVPVANGVIDAEACADLRTAYELEYARQYSRHVPDMEIEVLNWAVALSIPTEDHAVVGTAEVERQPEPCGTRSIYDTRPAERLMVPSYRRSDLQPGDFIVGPAIVTEMQTTTVVSSEFDLTVDAIGNLIMIRRTA
jgi:N-methylhydantoinase A